jgi:hypothetical protein
VYADRKERLSGQSVDFLRKKPAVESVRLTLLHQPEQTPRFAIANTRLPHGRANYLCQ